MIDFPLEQILENDVAEIGLKMKDKNILPGKDKLKGELKVKIRKHWAIHEVRLSLTRREYVSFEHVYTTHVPDPHHQGQTITQTHVEHYRADDRIDVWQDVMSGGLFHKEKEEYEFKYKIEKNQGHPASFSYISGNFKCAIEYFFTGSVISGDHNKSLSVILPIKIQAPEQEGTPVKMAVQTHLEGCCCSDLGVFAMSLNVDDPTIFIFQPVTGKYFFDNSQCQSNINAINCNITETINATGRKNGVGPPMSKSISNVLSQYTIPGLAIGQKRDDPLNLHIPITVRPPQDIASSRGTILSRSYTLHVSPIFDKCICGGGGGLSCPLYISNDEDVIDEMTNPGRIPQNMPPPGFIPKGPTNFMPPNSNIAMPPVYPQSPPTQNFPLNQNQMGYQNQPFPLNSNPPQYQNPQFNGQALNSGIGNGNYNMGNNNLNQTSNLLVK